MTWSALNIEVMAMADRAAFERLFQDKSIRHSAAPFYQETLSCHWLQTRLPLECWRTLSYCPCVDLHSTLGDSSRAGLRMQLEKLKMQAQQLTDGLKGIRDG